MLVVRLTVGLAIEAAIVGIALAVRAWSHDGWVALSTFLALTALYFLDSLRFIPAQPPHKGVLTILGRRMNVTALKEGPQFLPLYPIFGVILVNVTKVEQPAPDPEAGEEGKERNEPILVRTPDLAELEFKALVVWTPDPRYLINYLNVGGQNDVKKIIDRRVRERLRRWAIAADEGPATWQEALRGRDDATRVLIERITGVEIRPADVEPDEEEQRRIQEMMRRIREGNGVSPIPSLGIILNGLYVSEIRPVGELAAAAEKRVKETQDREGEAVKVDFVKDRTRELAKPINEGGAGLTSSEARRTVQVAQGDVQETVDTRIRGVSSETLEAIDKIISGVFGGQPPQPPALRPPRRSSLLERLTRWVERRWR